MAKLEDDILNEIDAFIEEEKKPKRKKRTKKEIDADEIQEKPKKRTRKKKEVIVEEPVVEETIEDIVEEEMNNVSVVTEDTAEIEEIEEKVEDTEEVPVVEEIVTPEVEDEEEEDIYITRSFQPIKKKKRLKRSVVKFFKILFVLAILGIGGYFVFNKVMDIYNSTRPLYIYRAFVDGVVDESTRVLGNINVDEYKLDIDVDTNMKSYEYLNNGNFGYGFNVKEDKYQDYIYYVDNYEEVGIYTLINDEKMYKQYSNNDDVYKVKYEDSNIRELIEFVSLNYDNLDDIIEGNGNIINDILKEEYIKVLDDEIDVNGENITVKCLSLEITDEIINEYIKEFKNDKELVNKMSKLLNKDEDKLVRYMEDKLNDMEGNKFNLYVTKDYKLVGFDYEIDGFRDVYVYYYNDSYDVSIKYDKYIKYLLNSLGIEVGNINNLNLKINDDNKINVAADNNDKFNLIVKEFDKSVISFEYKNNSSTKVMEVVIKKDSIVVEYKNDNGKYFDMDITLSKNEYSDMDLDDVIISSKKVREANDEFYSNMNRDQKDTYNLINEIVYGDK